LKAQIPKAFKPLFQPARYKVFWGGRGGAKSWNFARALLILGAQRPLRALCTREVQKSIKDSVHKLLSDQIQSLGLGAHYEVLQTEIRGINGTELIFSGLSSQTAESIKSFEGIDVCWVEEAQKVSDASWKILIPTIRKSGSEIWISFNPDVEHNATYQRFVKHPPEGAIVRKVSWRDNPWFSKELRDEMEHLRATDYEDYLHVWEGEHKAIATGAIYGKQLLKAKEDGRITRLPIETACQVHTFWDLGRNDHTAIWFMQEVGPQKRFIDYYESRLQDLDHYIRVLKERDYLYGIHFLPHDVEAKFLGMKETRKQQLESAGIKPIEVVPRIQDLNEGIEQTRKFFASCWIDGERCKAGLAALSNYVWDYDDEHDAHKPRPVHNWASNGADAFRQAATGYTTPGKVEINFDELYQGAF
jgi:phage terminase large subunit